MKKKDRKNKKTVEKEFIPSKHAFYVDTSKPLNELLKYSDKGHNAKAKDKWSRRKRIKERITQVIKSDIDFLCQ